MLSPTGPALASKQSKDWPYWLRLTSFFFFSLAIALLALPTLLGVLFTLGLLYAPCTGSSLTPADFGHPAEAVIIQGQSGATFRGYFVPGTNGATIIMPPPLAANRSVRLPEMDILARHGYAVLTFESRRCAELGPLSLGYREVEDVAAALTYLHSRPDVDPQRLGVHGFSSAGATAIMAAAQQPELKAVAAEGGYGDFIENALGREQGRGLSAYFLPIFRWAMGLTYRWVTGLSLDRLSPASVIDRIAPRPIMLIYGSREVSLPGGRRQLAAAGSNAELWVVEGAGHGQYLAVAPQAYETRLVAFFDRALLNQ